MSNYKRPNTNKDYIQADIAYRLGHVLYQYNKLPLKAEKNFKITLAISVLQTVLTQCTELIKTLKNNLQKEQHKHLLTPINTENYFGITTQNIIRNTFNDPLITNKIFEHLRNALSHPTGINLSSENPSTGYSTKEIINENLYSLTFISSPDTKNNRPKLYQTKKEVEEYIKEAKKNSRSCKLNYVSINGGFQLINCRIFQLTLTTEEITELALKLCTYLAQPIQNQWEEKKFNEKILSEIILAA